MSFTLGNQIIATVHATIPLYGVASADVELDAGAVLSGRQTLVMGDISLDGTIIDGGIVAGRGKYHWMSGVGGWRGTIPGRSYDSPQGVLRSSIIKDAAAACGETVVFGIPEARLGLVGAAGWMRAAGAAWDTLRALGVPWYVDGAGVTQIAERPALPASTDGTLEGSWPEDGRLLIVPASERLAGYMPGRILGGSQIVTLLVDAVPGEPIRLSLWQGSAADPSHDLRTQLARIIRQETAATRFHGLYRFVVVARNGTLYDLEPVDATLGLRPIKNRDLWPSAPGVDAQLRIGATVVLAFLDGSESMPVIQGYQRLAAGASAKPAIVSLDADRVNLGGASQLVARKNDVTTGPAISFQQVGPNAVAITVLNPPGTDGALFTATITSATALTLTKFPPLAAGIDTETIIKTPSQSVTYA